MHKSQTRRPETTLTDRLTSQPRVVRKSPRSLPVQAQSILVGMLSGRTVKAWRNEKKLSASKLGQALGYSRSYIKAIEGGSLPVSAKFATKFRELQQSINGHAFEPEPPKPCSVITHYELPSSFEILAKPVRCKGCGKWIIPRFPNQKTHATKVCRRKAERKARRRRARAKNTFRGHRRKSGTDHSTGKVK